MAIWDIFLNTTLQAAVHLGQDHEANFRDDQCGTVISRIWKTDQWTKSNHWYKNYDFQDATWMSTSLLWEKAYPKPTSSPTLYPEKGKWKMILLQPGGAKLTGFRNTITSRIWIESTECRRSSSGKHSCERRTVWTWAVQRQDHLHVKEQRHFVVRKRNYWRMCIAIPRQLQNMIVNSLAVIGHSWGLDQERNGTEPTPTNPTDPGIKLQRTWWRISPIPVIQ